MLGPGIFSVRLMSGTLAMVHPVRFSEAEYLERLQALSSVDVLDSESADSAEEADGPSPAPRELFCQVCLKPIGTGYRSRAQPDCPHLACSLVCLFAVEMRWVELKCEVFAWKAAVLSAPASSPPSSSSPVVATAGSGGIAQAVAAANEAVVVLDLGVAPEVEPPEAKRRRVS